MTSDAFEIVVINEPVTPGGKWFRKRLSPMSEAAASILAAGQRLGWVYFVQAGYSGSIKIGWAKNPEKRLKALQVSHATKLILLGVVPGDMEAERRFHEKFGSFRVRGEWFRRNDVIEPILALLTDGGLIPFDGKSRNIPEPQHFYSFSGNFTEA